MNADDARNAAPLTNDDSFAVSERERQEALVTAYALGELDPAERAEAERLLATPARPGARQQVAEVRAIATALKAGIDDEPPSRSAALRQAVLAAVTRPEPSRQRSAGRGWMLLLGALAASVLVVVAFPTLQTGMPAVRERLVADARTDATPPEATDKATPIVRDAERNSRRAGVEKLGSQAAKAANKTVVPHVGFSRAAAPAANGPGAASPAPAHAPSTETRQQEGIVARSRMADRAAPDQRIESGAMAAGGRDKSFAEQRLTPLDDQIAEYSKDVDTSSYSNVRQFLDSGRLPPPEAIRIEEFVNYFSYDYPPPDRDAPFSVTVDAAECPWNRGHSIMRVGLRGGMAAIVKDMKIEVELNPAQVASCRLLGDGTKDAGEIAVGNHATALYELTLAGEQAGGASVGSRELLTVKLRWKQTDGNELMELVVPLADRGPAFIDAPADLRFAAAVAAFAMILQGSDQKGEASLPLVASIAGGSLGRDEGGQRAEFLELVRKAEVLQGR